MYVISFTGILCSGYVKNNFFLRKGRDVPFKTHQEAMDFASKFRFKFMADFFCKMYNRMDYLRTFKVEEIPANNKLG